MSSHPFQRLPTWSPADVVVRRTFVFAAALTAGACIRWVPTPGPHTLAHDALLFFAMVSATGVLAQWFALRASRALPFAPLLGAGFGWLNAVVTYLLFTGLTSITATSQNPANTIDRLLMVAVGALPLGGIPGFVFGIAYVALSMLAKAPQKRDDVVGRTGGPIGAGLWLCLVSSLLLTGSQSQGPLIVPIAAMLAVGLAMMAVGYARRFALRRWLAAVEDRRIAGFRIVDAPRDALPLLPAWDLEFDRIVCIVQSPPGPYRSNEILIPVAYATRATAR